MAKNLGDEIKFVSDTYEDWPFAKGRREDIFKFKDVTEASISVLISAGLFIDDGYEYQDEDEPESVYIRALKLGGKAVT